MPHSFYPTDQEWVLRNLAPREFLRPTAAALDKAYIHGPFIDAISFGCNAVWAGDCLDIVPITYLDEGGPWKDIGDQVAQDIERIWKRKFGENWRIHVQEKERPKYEDRMRTERLITEWSKDSGTNLARETDTE
ncbi:hypothetical protein MGYG_07481 [Nannizzia gypsea CBS 118893]|uniref:Uncharacterized protein n=1 Tax=Arthroderma gypseum (strain ATCC MYA-4604 / CBS 118893) TaxID=535722 RepID=E4V399_ARTGP|nr:hypothetical protein MGYG_07481 [Nannizzia gypsea CBS 118893]EFR04473.1 hypothetical protein MGYG_07481 [Nannizzia gypsea CBS 118893]